MGWPLLDSFLFLLQIVVCLNVDYKMCKSKIKKEYVQVGMSQLYDYSPAWIPRPNPSHPLQFVQQFQTQLSLSNPILSLLNYHPSQISLWEISQCLLCRTAQSLTPQSSFGWDSSSILGYAVGTFFSLKITKNGFFGVQGKNLIYMKWKYAKILIISSNP